MSSDHWGRCYQASICNRRWMVLAIIAIIVLHLGVVAVHGLVWEVQMLLRHHRGKFFEFFDGTFFVHISCTMCQVLLVSNPSLRP